MSETQVAPILDVQPETPPPGDYSVVAWARGLRVLFFQEFGSYQGEWLMLARNNADYFVFKDSYGSCSGCDSYQAAFDSYGEDGTDWEKVRTFAADYPPFLEIPAATMRRLAENRTLMTVLPGNVGADRWTGGDIPYSEVATDLETIVRLEEGVPIEVTDVLATRNQEIKRRALEAVGAETFLAAVSGEEVDRDDEDALLDLGEHGRYLHLKDGSTERRYLLRVPPDMQRVRQAKAWSFGVEEAAYRPSIET